MIFKSATMCSGIGSPEQSLAELGIPHENVFACEKDKFARQTYLANFSPGIMYEDMTTESWDLPEQYADLIVAGIPCQSFSSAGKRKGENDPRGLLIYDFIRYVKNQRPKVFIIENVRGLLSDQGGVTFSKWCELLGANKNGQAGLFTNCDSCGYNLHYRVLNAKHYGLPQNRERVFIIGIRPDLVDTFKWPKKIVLKDRLIDILESEVDEKYYLSDEMMIKLSECGTFINQDTQASKVHDIFGCVPAVSAGTHGYAMGYINIPKLQLLQNAKFEADRIYDSNGIAKTQKANGGGGDLIKVAQLPGFESNGRVYSEQVLAPNIRAKQSGLIQIGDSYNLKMPTSTTRRGRHGKEIANSIETDCKQVVLTDNYRIRRYTPLECMRLMGYPDSFVKPCSETQTYKQAGNSIPVHMMKAILKQLLPILTA